MNGAPHPLTAVEVEALRQMRTRLAKTPASDAAAATVGRAALTVLARVGVSTDRPPAQSPATAAAFVQAAEAADLHALSVLAGALAARLQASPAGEPRAWIAQGAPQALISRRLQLAGRERVEPRG